MPLKFSPTTLKLLTAGTLLFKATLTFAASPVTTPIDCTKLPKWSSTATPINQIHIFCGEWDQKKKVVKGFHSRPAGHTQATITAKITEQPNQQGIYGIRWNYLEHSDVNKYSTMFPDNCTMTQVLSSVLYAAQHPQSCPPGAPSWAQCGPNQPADDNTAGYCAADDQSPFIISFALLDHKINTAFPLKQSR